MTDTVAHDKYYFDDIIIRIEAIRFKIPRALLLESPVFKQMFELPLADETIADGSDDEHPLKLEGVNAEEFGFFVRAAMARYIKSTPTATIVQESNAVLRLCDMWSFEELKADTITHLKVLFMDAQYAVWKFRIGKDHNILDWIGPAVETLIIRSATLSQEDIEILTPMTAAKIIALRERNLWRYCLGEREFPQSFHATAVMRDPEVGIQTF